MSKLRWLRLKPLDAFAIDPLAVSLAAAVLRIEEYPNAVLFIVPPTSNIFRSIGPDEGPLSILLPVLEVAFIAPAIVPGFDSATLNSSKSEFTLEDLIHICEIVLAAALELAIDKLTLVIAAVAPLKTTLALLLALEEVSGVPCASTIVPCLFSVAVLAVI
jgi:hypothetical protein